MTVWFVCYCIIKNINKSEKCSACNDIHTFPDNSECDVLTIPNRHVSEEFPPIIIEIQLTVDMSFYQRTNRYCLNVADRYNVAPLLMVFNIESFASAHFRDNSFIFENNYYTANAAPWCKKKIIFNRDTINPYLQKRRILKLIMLSYFFSSKEVDIRKLEHRENADLKLFYRIATEIFGDVDIKSQKKNIGNIRSVEDSLSFIKAISKK